MAVDLLYIAVIFLVVALAAYFVGARGFAWFSADLAKLMIWVFIVLALISLVVRFIF
jgi:uncharacterized membrane protein YtjA (UPF0391 family)